LPAKEHPGICAQQEGTPLDPRVIGLHQLDPLVRHLLGEDVGAPPIHGEHDFRMALDQLLEALLKGQKVFHRDGRRDPGLHQAADVRFDAEHDVDSPRLRYSTWSLMLTPVLVTLRVTDAWGEVSDSSESARPWPTPMWLDRL